jgi:hypothetical protein
MPHLFSVANENPSGLYISSQTWGSFKANDIAVSAQLEKVNGLGFGIELGFRQQAAAFAYTKKQQVLTNESFGEFFSNSFYLAPGLVHSFRPRESVTLNVYSSVELHFTFRNTQKTGKSGSYEFRQEPFFTQPKLGFEARKQLKEAFWAALFFEVSHAINPISTLTRKDPEGNISNFGHFNGAGFNLGLRLSLCWACLD